MLARDLGDCRDNLRNSRSVFLIVRNYEKQGSNKSYQTLITVDADETTHAYSPKFVSKDEYYRQRITVNKVDEDGKGLPGQQFTLDAKNIDELYSFEVTDRDGTDLGTADTNNDLSLIHISEPTRH